MRQIGLSMDRGLCRGGFQTRPGATDAEPFGYPAVGGRPRELLGGGFCRSGAGLKPAPTNPATCALPWRKAVLWRPRTTKYVGWVELARPNTARGNVGSREELDPTYGASVNSEN